MALISFWLVPLVVLEPEPGQEPLLPLAADSDVVLLPAAAVPVAAAAWATALLAVVLVAGSMWERLS